jgi:hypothetical protein
MSADFKAKRLTRPELRRKALIFHERGLKPGEINLRLWELYAARIGTQVIVHWIERDNNICNSVNNGVR